MTPDRLIEAIDGYETLFKRKRIVKQRVNLRRTLASCTSEQLLSYAYYLCDSAKEYLRDPKRWGEAIHTFASIQMCLSFADLLSLEEVHHHATSDITR